jgi:hypothetical protein
MKFLPCSWRTCDSVLRTFFTQKGVVNRVIYELPKHEDVHKHTKMRLVEKNGNWFVIADIAKKSEHEHSSCVSKESSCSFPFDKYHK